MKYSQFPTLVSILHIYHAEVGNTLSHFRIPQLTSLLLKPVTPGS